MKAEKINLNSAINTARLATTFNHHLPHICTLQFRRESRVFSADGYARDDLLFISSHSQEPGIYIEPSQLC